MRLQQGDNGMGCTVMPLQVKKIVEDSIFWSNLEHAITFLQPFSDFIHQIEADRPALGRCYEGLMVLDKHVRNAIETMRADPQLASDADRVLSTWQRRLDNMHSSAVQPLLNLAVKQRCHTSRISMRPLQKS
jgi:hypothetical protein